MPTLLLKKTADSGSKTKGGQLRPALPGLRLPLQPAATATLAAAPQRHRPAPSRRKPLAEPGDVAWLVHRGSTPDLTPASDPAPEADASGTPLSPVAFARNVLGVTPWHKQEEVLNALTQHRRVAVKSGNGLGKGFCAAVAVLWFMHAHPESAIALTTAPTFRQVRHILWRQIHRLYRPAAQVLGGTMYDTRWEISADRYAMGLSADGADQFQGFHNPYILIVVDEAEGVSEEIYEAVEAVMTSAEPLLLLIGNPTTMGGAFRRAFHEEREVYHPITISALESPNVGAGRVVVPGLTTAKWVEERKQIWKEDSIQYRSRVLGEFSNQSEDTLLPLNEVEAAVGSIVDAESWSVDDEPLRSSETSAAEEVILAVDVARFGSDSSVILRRRGNCVEDIQAFQQEDTMQLTGRVAAAIRQHNPARVVVDEIGIGAGVVDRLRELGHPVRGINVAQKALDEKSFANLRAEGYWNLAERFKSGLIRIPGDSELIRQLSTLRYSFDSQGRIKIESKDDIRKRHLPSPDKADALMLAFLVPKGRFHLWI